MNAFHMFGFVVLVHVTVITSIAILLISLVRQRSAFQHTVGVIGLLLALSSPILVPALPQSNWFHASQKSTVKPDLRMSGSTINAPSIGGTEPEVPSAEKLAAVESTRLGDPKTATRQERNPQALAVHANPILLVSINCLFAVWFLGSVLAAYRLWKSRRTLTCLSHSWKSISPVRLERIEDDVCTALKIDKLPPIRIAELAPIPLIVGVLKPVVVLPQDVADSANDERLRDVLIHECAHIVRRDPWVHATQQVAAVVFWIHPGIHWLNQQISRVREELCDNFVIRQGDAADYAQTLLVLAESCRRQRLSFSTLGLFTSRWTLESRICDLLDLKRNTMTQTRWRTRLGLGVLFGVISVLIGGLGVVAVSSADQQVEVSKSLKAENPAVKKPESPPVSKRKKITVRGKCVDDDWNAISNAEIRVFRYQYSSDPPVLVGSVKSDRDGHFELEGVESAADRDMPYLIFTASAIGHASGITYFRGAGDEKNELKLSSHPQTLSGKVTDVSGLPISNVHVSLCPFDLPPVVLSAITDEHGRYEITDAAEWFPQQRQVEKDANGRTVIYSNASQSFWLRHPDFPVTRAHCTRIPQEVNVTLKPPAIIEGRVIDAMTNKPVPNVTVSAQGVARFESFQAKTDDKGRYRLQVTKDHYNIWAEMDERIAIAVKAIEAVPGKTLTDADINMVQGGFVVGTLINGETNEPITAPEERIRYVAHYGPARPQTGAAVTVTTVNSDGTYRLRVAPGRNYVYLMNGDMAQYVTVEDGEELKLDLVSGKSEPERGVGSDRDRMLQSELIGRARKEDAEEAAANNK